LSPALRKQHFPLLRQSLGMRCLFYSSRFPRHILFVAIFALVFCLLSLYAFFLSLAPPAVTQMPGTRPLSPPYLTPLRCPFCPCRPFFRVPPSSYSDFPPPAPLFAVFGPPLTLLTGFSPDRLLLRVASVIFLSSA